MPQRLREFALCLLSAGLAAAWSGARPELDERITARSVSITDGEGRTRIRLEAEGEGAFLRLFDAFGVERASLSCAPSPDQVGDDESTVQLRLNRRSGARSIAIVHEDERQHGDRQSIAFAYDDGDVDRLRLSSLWFGLEDGAELSLNNRDGRALVYASTGALASHPTLGLRTYDSEGVDGRLATVPRWLRIGHVGEIGDRSEVMGCIVGQGSTRVGLGVSGAAEAFVSAEDERGAAALVPGE